jgi:hypothetical protein
MRWISILLLVLLAKGVAANEIWRWVDENGVVQYSDRPRPGAERVDLRPVQSYQAPATPAPANPQASAGRDQDEKLDNPYRRLSVLSPAAGETIWNIGGQLNVELAVDPAVREAHALRVYLDGEQVDGVPPAQTQFTIGNVFRGERKLKASIVDEQGRELVSSGTVVFYVQQTSVNNPNNPNNPNRPRVPAPPAGGG